MQKFNERLRRLRKIRKLTQKDIAIQIGVKQNTYSDWENGKTEPKIQYLIDLSSILQVSIDYLLDKNNNDDEIDYFSKEKSEKRYLKECELIDRYETNSRNRFIYDLLGAFKLQRITKEELSNILKELYNKNMCLKWEKQILSALESVSWADDFKKLKIDYVLKEFEHYVLQNKSHFTTL